MLIIDYYISSKRRKPHDGNRGQGQGQGQGFHLQLLTASHVAMNMQISCQL